MTDRLIVLVREERHSHSAIRRVSLSPAKGPLNLFFEISGDVIPPPLKVHDFALISALFIAMREARAVHVEGAITETLLRNLEEFQEAWALWRPKYRPIHITADETAPSGPMVGRSGVFAFSGGVDGMFALLRHYHGRAGLRSVLPVCAMLVHGFDIALGEHEAYDRARRRAAEMLNPLNIPLATLRTNWKTDACVDWGMEFMAGIAACLHQFHGLTNVGVLGADEDYAHLEFPWGSNPITNQLLSGGLTQLHTEGAGFTRTDRVRLICNYPDVASKLRVCWEGPVTGKNCGRCEKCVRTQMNFLANHQKAPCFETDLGMAQILGVSARNRIQLAYLQEILSSARTNGASGAWTFALSLAIAKNRLLLPSRNLEKRIRARLRRTFGSRSTKRGALAAT